jgi:GNAT superfamily N-acetyltransferase
MEKIIQEITRDELLCLNEKNLLDYIRTYSRTAHNEFIEDDETMLAITDIPAVSILNNCVFRMNPRDGNQTEKKVDEILSMYRQRKLPVYWYVSPATSPKDLPRILKSKKMMHIDTYSFMSMDLNRLPSKRINDRIQIKQVDNIDALREWIRLYVVCFELAGAVENEMLEYHSGLFLDSSIPACHYIGYLNGKPVGTSSVFYSSGIAGIYNIVTAPEARNIGIGYDLTLTALAKAKDEGFRYATLQATKLGEPVYRRLGFDSYGKAECFVETNGMSLMTLSWTFIMRTIANFLRSKLYRIK